MRHGVAIRDVVSLRTTRARLCHSGAMRTTLLCALLATIGCSSSSSPSGPQAAPTASSIKHLVVVIQENHSFDAYFGAYCTGTPGSNPSCNDGPACCEQMPSMDPGTGMAPTVLDDNENATFDPNHLQQCELAEMNGGKMDKYVTAPSSDPSVPCGSSHNFAQAARSTVGGYWDLAASGALADHYFQPIAGQSSSNDMYFARAQYVFTDNEVTPTSIGIACQLAGANGAYTDLTIGDVLSQANVPWAFYAEGYQTMVDAQMKKQCPKAPADCAAAIESYPCTYDPGDNPFQYYDALRDDPKHMLDYARFSQDLSGGTLPGVSFVKGLGYHSEHPGTGDTISAGVAFVQGVVSAVQGSPYASSTLVLVTFDESGGYFDHVAPPPPSAVDNQPYGPRVPLFAVGPFAKKNYVSHTTMEHSSVVKFIEWNWLARKTGQLSGRDASVANLGDLLDPSKTGTMVPTQ